MSIGTIALIGFGAFVAVTLVTPWGQKGWNALTGLVGIRFFKAVDSKITPEDRQAMLEVTAEKEAHETVSELLGAAYDAQGTLQDRDEMFEQQAQWQKVLDEAVAARERLEGDGIEDKLQAEELGAVKANGQRAWEEVQKMTTFLNDHAGDFARAEDAIKRAKQLAGDVDDDTAELIREGRFDTAMTRLANAETRINSAQVKHLNSSAARTMSDKIKQDRKTAEGRAKVSGEFANAIPSDPKSALRQIRKSAGGTNGFDEYAASKKTA